ncbi:uncharacterized protein DMAD_07967 [Drosophila madeirensis]|uniref:Uncharacterized protein n=1 Tax=Drosophila madeirensis TaxID=30013 RepID=A0AAU9EQB1_DROMD
MSEMNESSEIEDQDGWTTESECDMEETNDMALCETTVDGVEEENEEQLIPRGNSILDCVLLGIVLLLFLVHHLQQDLFHFYVWTIQLDLAAQQRPRPLKLAWYFYNVLLLIFSLIFYVLLRLRVKVLVQF